MTAQFKTLPTIFTEKNVANLFLEVMKYSARLEYQPKAIAIPLNSAIAGDQEAFRTLIGCGGGKSKIFVFAIVLAILSGKKKVVITAPGKPLLRQLEYDVIECLALFAKAGYKVPSGISFFNVSSDKKYDNSLNPTVTLEDTDLEPEHEDEDEDDDDEIAGKNKEMDNYAKSIRGIRDTKFAHHESVKKELRNNDITIFFVCKPSFLNSFAGIVNSVSRDPEFKDRYVIDITCHDEYHNFISQARTDRTKKILTSYQYNSPQNWFYSASKKYVKGFCWDHITFGKLVVDVPSSELVKLGYLVKDIKIFYITTGMIRGISHSIREYFKGIAKKTEPEKFYREAAVILAVMEHQLGLKSIPKTLVFGSRIAFLKEMQNSADFVTRLEEIITQLKLYRMDGSTKPNDREKIFAQLKKATYSMATLLLQHSVCKEGIDAPNFNSAVICRGLSEISLQQALGRIQRSYTDIENGVVKEVAYLYIFVKGDENKLGELAEFIHYNYGEHRPEMQPMLDNDEGGNDEDDENESTDVSNPGKRTIKLLKTNVDIEEFMKRKFCELFENDDRIKYDAEYKAMSIDDLFDAMPAI